MSRWTWIGTVCIGIHFGLFSHAQFSSGNWLMGVGYLLFIPSAVYWAYCAYREGQRDILAWIDAELGKPTQGVSS